MPIYDFKCLECGEEMSGQIMTVSEYARPACPKCGAEMHPNISSMNFALKGEGWTPRFHRRSEDHE